MASKLPFERSKEKRERFDKYDAETDPAFGEDPESRPIEALLDYSLINIDKPPGPTSHQVTDYAKRILGVKKAGHSGTLDPGVTGCLPVAMGRATRIVQLLLPAGKEYVALMHLHEDVEEDDIRAACKKFLGRIQQLPPVRSAVKRQLRERSIYYLDILEIKGRDVLFVTGTQAGTYIRKLIHDIGRGLGCGAHMAELRRSRVGPFTEDTAVTLHDLADAMAYYKDGNDKPLRGFLQPIERAVDHLPKAWVVDTAVDPLCHGASLYKPGLASVESGIVEGDRVAMMTLKGELVGCGVAMCTSGEMMEEKGVALRSDKIFMNPGVYPKRVREEKE